MWICPSYHLAGASPLPLDLGVPPHSCSSVYCLTGVSLALDMGYLFTAAPAKHSHCSWPWKWGIFSWPPLLTLDVGYLLMATTPRTWGISSQLLQHHVWMRELDYKKAECWRIDTFELWHWRRLLRVPWTARRSNQSILKKISPECLLEGLMLKLRLQYFGHLMWRADSLEKTLMLERLKAGGEGDYRGWDAWMSSPTEWAWVWVNSGSW